MLRTIIGVIALIADDWSMNREYKDGHLIGVLFWGILLLCVVVAMV